MVVKTRERLLEVARQLFVHKGVENTTMNDIAKASDKGRRTVYTYFRNKREIYNAVLESDSEMVVEKLRAVASDPTLDAPAKLERFLALRIEQGKLIASNLSTLKSLIKFDLKRMSRMRSMVHQKERAILASILDQGVADGVFDACQSENLMKFIVNILQALDIIGASEAIDFSPDTAAFRGMTAFVTRGLGAPTPPTAADGHGE